MAACGEAKVTGVGWHLHGHCLLAACGQVMASGDAVSGHLQAVVAMLLALGRYLGWMAVALHHSHKPHL